jgi:Uma2 family endonuclease
MSETEASAPPRMTVDEFLAWDGGGHQGRLELVAGRVRTTPTASATQALIQGNLIYLVGAHIRAKGLPDRVGFRAPVVPRLSACYHLRTPDLVVTRSTDPIMKLFPEPLLVAEVRSEENEPTIRESFWAYTTIPSVKEILIVDAEVVRAEIYRVGSDGFWVGPVIVEAGGTIRLDSLDASFPIAEVYAGTYLA